MSEENSLYPADWTKIAQKDWGRTKFMLEKGDAEASGYFLQQSLEKYLKAFLLQKGWELKKIHELDALLDDAVKYKPELEPYRELCERVSGYYFFDRYPRPVPSKLTIEDIERDMKEAQGLIKMLSIERHIK